MSTHAARPSICSKCGLTIQVGDEVSWDRALNNTDVYHTICPNPYPLKAEINFDPDSGQFGRVTFSNPNPAPRQSLVSIDDQAAEDMARDNVTEATELLVDVVEQLAAVEKSQFLMPHPLAEERRQLIEQAARLARIIKINTRAID